MWEPRGLALWEKGADRLFLPVEGVHLQNEIFGLSNSWDAFFLGLHTDLDHLEINHQHYI